jgi:uncharacterized protein (UPF0297 family)
MSLINEHIVKQEILKEINELVNECSYVSIDDIVGYLIESETLFMKKIDEILEKKLK